MRCNRPDCENIMCDTYVNNIGYVCDECKEEFKEYLKTITSPPQTEWEIHNAFKKFMETEKNIHRKGKEMDVDEFFDKYTRNQ